MTDATDTDRLAFVPEATLRDLVWRAASAVAEHAGVTGDPVIAEVLMERRLSPDAELAARRSQLQAYREHSWLWQALHNATNPDPLAAAIGAPSAARYAAGPSGEDLLEHARRVARQRCSWHSQVGPRRAGDTNAGACGEETLGQPPV
ncbi:hypothetical protein ACIA2T_15800 [Amycolatopsis japonica]|uniref:hypothetical protein n=1 Tax=Amycolatopsis japonica TaxID=208439 RepID=UPI0037AE6252